MEMRAKTVRQVNRRICNVFFSNLSIWMFERLVKTDFLKFKLKIFSSMGKNDPVKLWNFKYS